MAGFGGAIKLTGESDYRKALKQITLDLKEVDSELKVVATQYDKNDKSQEALTAQSEALAKKMEAQAKKVGVLKDSYKTMSAQAEENKAKHEALKKELEGAVAELEKIEKESGKTSAEYKLQMDSVAYLTTEYEKSSKAIDNQDQALSKARIEINKAQSDYNTTSRTLEGLTASEEDSAKGSKDLGKAVSESGKEAEKSAKGGFTVLKGALANLASDAIKNAISGMKSLAKEVSKAATEAVSSVIDLGDSISDNSKKLGISAEAYQELGYVFEQNGADIESFKSGFLKLTKAIESGDEAFQELGISAEALKTMSREEIFEATLKGLQGIQDENKKTILSTQLLGKGAMELGAVLSDTTDIDALKARVHELGGVMSNEAVDSADKMQDSLTDMKTAINGIKVSIVTQFLPSLNEVVDGLTDIFSGGDLNKGFDKILKGVSETADTILNKILPKVIEMIPRVLESGLPVIISGIETVVSSLGEQLPDIISKLFGAVKIVITDLAEWLSQEGNVSELLSGVLGLVVDLTNQFAQLLPVILPAIVQVVAEVAKFLTAPENLDLLLNSTILVVGEICKALIKSLPSVLKILENLGLNIVEGFVKTGGKVKEAFSLLISWVKTAFTNWIKDTASKISQASASFLGKVSDIKTKILNFVTNIFDTIKELPKKVVSIGANIASGIWEGLNSKLNYLKQKISDFGKSIISKIKSVFQIASPSKVTKSLGAFLAEGLGVGFSDEMKSVNEDIKSALPTFDNIESPSVSGSLATTGGLDYYTMVSAFKEALESVNIELDDQKVGKFVKKTVTQAIYT